MNVDIVLLSCNLFTLWFASAFYRIHPEDNGYFWMLEISILNLGMFIGAVLQERCQKWKIK